MVCRINIYALLSASGTGVFVEVLQKDNMLPSPEKSLPPISLDQRSTFYPEEEPFFPTLQKLSRETFLVALRVGQLGRDFRTEARSRQYETDPLFILHRQTHVQNLHRALDHSQASWRIRFPEYWTWLGNLDSLPQRVFTWVQQVRPPPHHVNNINNCSPICCFALA
jgi:hypothetical protein